MPTRRALLQALLAVPFAGRAHAARKGFSPPDDAYLANLSGVFVDVAAEVVSFPNPLQDRMATNTVYLATKPS